MVVLFFAVSKGSLSYSTREYADYLKKVVLVGVDQKKVVPLEVFYLKLYIN
jgi:hypothetical protein